jgi:flagellar basal body-associated protein FliL
MSEGTDSSVTSGENAKPEPIAPPTGGSKRKLWMIIAAVAVVAILVGTALYVMFLAPLKTSMSPDEITIDAGQMKALSVSVKKGINTLTNDEAVKYRWRLTPDTLATFNFKSKPNVNLTAGNVAGTGTLTCEITYKGETRTLTKTVTVKPPYLDQIIVSPTTKTLDKGMSKVFTASAVDSVGNPVENLSYAWSVSGVTVTVNATTGVSVNLTAGTTYGNATLNASATWQSVSKTGAANVIVGPLPPRKIDYLWYKMFDVPFGDWWSTRWSFYKTEKVMTNSYPYMYQFYASPEGNVKTYANARLNITARNVTAINMNDNPEFLPLHGSSRGGTAVIDWYMEYLTSAEIEKAGINAANDDGWVIGLNGTVTLDKEAAMSVIKGLSSAAFDTFTSWWANHGTDVSNDITAWLAHEAGKDRLNIYPAYDGSFQMMAGTINGAKVGDKVVLTYNVVTWGMEAVIMRWLREAFMPTEWWFSDMNFHAVIGPELTRLDIDAAVSYALYAFETTTLPEQPCWVFEGMLQDVDPSAPPDVVYSDYDKYMDFTYLNKAPGNKYFGQMMGYDYTPGAWNLSANETLTFQWPSGQLPFLVHVNATEGSNYASTSAANDTMVVRFAEPTVTDNSELAPGHMTVDNTAREVQFTGPIDIYNWGKNQQTYDDLKTNWSRIGLLPHGLPWIEFQKEHGLVTWPAEFAVSEVPEMPVVDTPVNITVSVKDNYGRAYTEFSGEIHFEANRSDIDLPADYVFDPAVDGGRHKFTDGVTFHGLGYYQINVSAVGGNATGTCTDIWVIPEPEEVTGFQLSVLGVRGIVIKGLATSVEVTVFNQYPSPHNVFKGYNGTAMFSTNATAGTYTLPADATFSPANKGMTTLSGLLYNEMGTYLLTVTDQLNTSATESVTVVVSVPPEIDYRLYDMFEQPWGDWWPWRLGTYKTDILLNSKPHEYTFVYNKEMRNLQGIIYAPYRWNVTAKNMTTLNVHMPEFMPIVGTPDVSGAAAEMHIWFQYLDNASWNGYWYPTWSGNWNWSSVLDALMPAQYLDGYYLGTLYTISMNREAALEWLGMPMTDDPATWWTANRATYMSGWQRWLNNEANFRLDIWPAYEYPYIDQATLMDLVPEVDGKLTLKIANFNFGYEILMTRWLREVALCAHEPYYEDFNLSAHYTEEYTNVSYDAVCQYNLHAVKANETANSAAWVWEPQRIDYVAMPGSDFNPWELRSYTSWNSGDGYFGTDVPYDSTPQWFNLTSYMTFEIQLPTQSNVIGYMGENLTTGRNSGAIWELKKGNTSAYENITVHGPMELGYNMTGLGPGAPNLWDYYNPATKTLKMVGPIDFDNYRFWDGLLYHSAPWIEFNVANVTGGATTSLPVSSGPSVEESAGSGAALSEMAALAAVLMATSLAVVALGAGARRKD